MKLINVNEIVSVKLFTIEISEDELDVFEMCTKYLLETLSPSGIEQASGATKDELSAINEEISRLLKQHTTLR